jgi:hypothetical protein
MRKQSLILGAAAVLVSGAIASVQSQTPSQYDKSGAPTGLQSMTPDKPPVSTVPEANAPPVSTVPEANAPETTGQAQKFDDRWPTGTPNRPSAAVPAAPPSTTGQASDKR